MQFLICRKLFPIVFMVLQLAPGQPRQNAVKPKSNEEAQELLNDKRYSFEDLLQRKPEAVATARRIYALTSDAETKQRAASILLSIGITEQAYREYLEQVAREALADKTPWPTQYQDKHKKTWSPVFLDWCKKRALNPTVTRENVYYEIPKPWYFLAASGDRHFYNLLIEGLHSQNQMIVILAAKGLAKLQDTRAIAVLIGVGRQALGEARFGIGQSLLYFHCPDAQAAAEDFLTSAADRESFEVFRKQAQEEGLKALFPW